MKPLPIRAVQDLMRMLNQPVYRDQRLKLWLSYFEIYGGKLYDLLSERKLVFLFLFSYLFQCHVCCSVLFLFAFEKVPLDNTLVRHIPTSCLHLYAIGHCSIYTYTSISVSMLFITVCLYYKCTCTVG